MSIIIDERHGRRRPAGPAIRSAASPPGARPRRPILHLKGMASPHEGPREETATLPPIEG